MEKGTDPNYFLALHKADESFPSRLRRHDTDRPNLKSQIVTSSCECRGRRLRPPSLHSSRSQFVTLNGKPPCRPDSISPTPIPRSTLSGDQLLVQFVKYHAQLVREQLMGLAEAALLRERRIFEVVGLNSQIRGDVVADHFEPAELFFCETCD